MDKKTENRVGPLIVIGFIAGCGLVISGFNDGNMAMVLLGGALAVAAVVAFYA